MTTRDKINAFAQERIGFIEDGELRVMSRADAAVHLNSRGEYSDWVWNRNLTTPA